MKDRKLWRIFPAKKVKCWKSSERVGNEINSSTVLVGNFPHVMPCRGFNKGTKKVLPKGNFLAIRAIL